MEASAGTQRYVPKQWPKDWGLVLQISKISNSGCMLSCTRTTNCRKSIPLQQYHCVHEYFFFPWNRKARDTNNVTDWAQWGWSYGMWAHHYRFINAEREKRGIDWWFNAATAPDSHGFFNMSYGVNNCNIFKQTAKKIVFEVRSDYPWAEGGRFNTIHIDDIDYWVEVDCEKYKWPQINERGIKPKPEEEAIAKHVMSIMRDRDIVQLGIGSLPSACVAAMETAGSRISGSTRKC